MDKMKALILVFAFMTSQVNAASVSLEQVLQNVIDYYPSIQVAALQVDKADKESARILSSLGWRLAAQAGISNGVAFTGSTVNQATIAAQLEKVTDSGNIISLSTQANWEDAEQPFIPSFSNPGTVSSASVSYRQPLQKGQGNLQHHIALDNNKQQVQLARANLSGIYNQLASQIISLYFAAANTLSRLDNIKQAISRTQRLQKFISGRLNLGIAENKDQLQVDAQYKNQNAQLKALNVVWVEQQIALNRLMGKQWDNKLNTITPKPSGASLANMTSYINDINKYDPQLQQINSEIQLAQSRIKLQRENKRNNLDLVMHIGQQTRSDGFSLDSKDYSETIGGLRIEYKEALDKTGNDAAIFQAQLDNDISLQRKSLRQQEIRYEVASLLASLEAARLSVQAYQESIQTELSKLKEADSRYRNGRIDIDLLLQFKAQLSTAELSYSLQLIQVSQREYQLKRLRGEIWKSINLPSTNSIDSTLNSSTANNK